jgi:hypothetical protein
LVSDRSELFKPENVRVDQSYLAGTAKKLLTIVPVKKPNPQAFIRVHEEEQFRENVALLELKEERETYLVAPSLLPELDPGEFYVATLYLCHPLWYSFFVAGQTAEPRRQAKRVARIGAGSRFSRHEAMG